MTDIEFNAPIEQDYDDSSIDDLSYTPQAPVIPEVQSSVYLKDMPSLTVKDNEVLVELVLSVFDAKTNNTSTLVKRVKLDINKLTDEAALELEKEIPVLESNQIKRFRELAGISHKSNYL